MCSSIGNPGGGGGVLPLLGCGGLGAANIVTKPNSKLKSKIKTFFKLIFIYIIKTNVTSNF